MQISEHEAADLRLPVLHTPIKLAPVVIDDGCDIGAGAILLPGVTIGRGALVGAGAVVTRHVEPFTVVAGVPAKMLRQRWEGIGTG